MFSTLFGSANVCLSVLELLYAVCLGYWWPNGIFNKAPSVTISGDTALSQSDAWSRSDAALAFATACIMFFFFLIVGVNYLLRHGKGAPVILLIVVSLFGVGVAIASVISSTKLYDQMKLTGVCSSLIQQSLKCSRAECTAWAVSYCINQSILARNTIIFSGIILGTRLLATVMFISGIFLKKKTKKAKEIRGVKQEIVEV